uniref:AAA+ ATPase domain-containing protein n=1 Tax=Noctiluca scintillans TaxID=2966 RepID=A0A7S1FAI1_NOCSC|mmetsp:Transcript_48157/g.127518  ORF Transcript_48157/g.127518 Transcript_48157/m.127518 type:complete len:561 (+) Transcript_48157:50-1732(+)
MPLQSGGRQSVPQEGANALANAHSEDTKIDVAGRFDPANLERGATALTAIDKSDHAHLAFDMVSMQEKTKHLEISRNIEVAKTDKLRAEAQACAMQAQEQQKTISHVADQERETAQMRAQLEHASQQKKLEFNRDQLDYKLNRENEQFMQQEKIRLGNDAEMEERRRETMRLRAKLDQDAALDAAKIEAQGAAQQERENIEIRLRQMRAQKAEERKTRLSSIEEIFTGLNSGAQALYEDRAKAVAVIAGLTTLAFGVYGARASVRVASAVLEQHLNRPPLVRETSRWSFRPSITWLPWAKNETPNIMQNIILEEKLAERLQWTTNALLRAQQNGTPFRHLMLHGAPGTGKTLFARTLARQSGLDYAIMSGGDLGPLGRDGPNELHKLFKWAHNSRRGMVLFIDEADSFLRRGRGGTGAMSEDARNALSVFLHHTGTENMKIAIILATNVPRVLDTAVLDRIDEDFEFPLPAYDQRLTMIRMFVDYYVCRPTKKGRGIEMDEQLDDAFMANLAHRTEGMSGRQLAKLALAFQSAVFGSGTQRLTLGLADTVLQWRLANPSV